MTARKANPVVDAPEHTVAPMPVTVTLHTIADLAAHLGITGQQVSALHKNPNLATPVPAFQIIPTYGRRSFELLWSDANVADWVEFMDRYNAKQADRIAEQAAKAVERAAKAQAALAKAQAAVAKAEAAVVVDPDQLTLEV